MCDGVAGGMSTKHQQYAAIRTGDILFFSGWGRIALLLRTATGSIYTHTGIAVWLNTSDGRRLYTYDCGPLRRKDAMNPGTKKAGIRLVDIDFMLKGYSKLAYRSINVVRNKKFYDTLRNFMREYHHKEFRPSMQFLTMHVRSSKPEGDGMYCTELCSTWLERLGLLTNQELQDKPHWKSTPGYMAAEDYNIAFRGNTMVVFDEGHEENTRNGIAGLLVLTLMVYIFITIVLTRR